VVDTYSALNSPLDAGEVEFEMGGEINMESPSFDKKPEGNPTNTPGATVAGSSSKQVDSEDEQHVILEFSHNENGDEEQQPTQLHLRQMPVSSPNKEPEPTPDQTQ
jgi:hypothetical protein